MMIANGKPGPQMCSAWRASLHHHCKQAKPLLSPLPLPPSPPAVSHRRFLAFSDRRPLQRAWGHASWSQGTVSSVVARTFAFYSPVRKDESQALAGGLRVMDIPAADGNNVNTPQESLLREVEQALGSTLGTEPQAPVLKPLVLVISGPSGVGKDAVINRLKEVRDELQFVVTATTRAKRPGEIDGKDYFFVTKQEFESMIQKNELLEHAVVYGDFKGIPKRQVRDFLAKGFDVVLRVDVQGAATIRSILGSDVVFIFLVAESEAALVKRLAERKTETKDKLLLRMATAREELKRIKEFDYVVVNVDGQLEKTVSLISHIIDAEKCRVHQREASL